MRQERREEGGGRRKRVKERGVREEQWDEIIDPERLHTLKDVVAQNYVYRRSLAWQIKRTMEAIL